MFSITTFLLLLAIAAATAGLVRKVKIPLPLLQIAAGVVLAWPIGLHVELEPEAFLLIFIAPLLFIDGNRIPKGDFRRFRKMILTLAFGLVIATVLVIGTLVEVCLPAIPPFVAFALASALSPTDAVAVSGISGNTPVPSKLMSVLQGEALFNDASGLVCLNVAIGAIVTGGFSWSRAAGSLVVVAVGGIIVGLLLAFLFARFQRLVFGSRADVPEGRILLVVALPFAAFELAEHFHLSGILAAATAGMTLLRFGLFDQDERVARTQTVSVLHALELGLNGVVFVLLGLQLPAIFESAPHVVREGGFGSWWALGFTIIATGVGLLLMRFAWVLVSMKLAMRRGRPIPMRLVLAISFAGARGAVSLAATLTLPLVVDTPDGPYPAREVGVCIAAAVILLSLVAASIGLPLTLRGVELDDDVSEQRLTVRAALVEAAIAAVEQELENAGDSETTAAAANIVLDVYRSHADQGDEAAKLEGAVRRLRLIGVIAERRCLHELFRERKIEDVTFFETLRRLDSLEDTLAEPVGHH